MGRRELSEIKHSQTMEALCPCLVREGIEGKVAVVTGAASGMGKATALRFSRTGAHDFKSVRKSIK